MPNTFIFPSVSLQLLLYWYTCHILLGFLGVTTIRLDKTGTGKKKERKVGEKVNRRREREK